MPDRRQVTGIVASPIVTIEEGETTEEDIFQFPGVGVSVKVVDVTFFVQGVLGTIVSKRDWKSLRFGVWFCIQGLMEWRQSPKQELIKESRFKLLQQFEDKPVSRSEPRVGSGVVIYAVVVKEETVDALREEVTACPVFGHLVMEK